MKLGIVSDLHSNIHALDAVVAELAHLGIDHLIVLGDFFGYYPWAKQTWEKLLSVPWPMTVIKGNHDEMLLSGNEPAAYAACLAQNRKDLADTNALETLRQLPFSREVQFGNRILRLVHGTPTDSENGRHYPTDSIPLEWEIGAAAWLLLGHTHYPLFAAFGQDKFILNPGSVGQPRDGDPRASFATLDLELNQHVFHRVDYAFETAQAALRRIHWCERSIRALGKRHSGNLDTPIFRS